MSRVGLMLYSVRDECARDFEETLRRVAGQGYEGVELYDLHGRTASGVRALLDRLGLEPVARHAALPVLESEMAQLAAEAEELGTTRVVLSWIEPPATVADAHAVVDRIARVAEEAGAYGLDLGFHNHDAEVRELEGGRRLLDDLLDLPIFLELDLGWAWWAGVDPLELLDRTTGRVPLVHVKDFGSRGERSFCPVGDGGVGYERVAPAAVAAGVEWLLVEQDETDGPSLDASARSLRALTRMLEGS